MSRAHRTDSVKKTPGWQDWLDDEGDEDKDETPEAKGFFSAALIFAFVMLGLLIASTSCEPEEPLPAPVLHQPAAHKVLL